MKKKVFYFFINRNLINWLPDKIYLKIMYYCITNTKINFTKVKTFNEKLQWLKIYDRKAIYTQMADKYLVRDFIKKRIGDEYLIPIIGHWKNFEDINFSSLPNQFVLKCNHDSGGVIICNNKDNFDVESAKIKFNIWLKHNYFYKGREWPYKNIKPQIICEKYMGKNLKDYKFMCFNGVFKCSFICSERNTPDGLHVTFYDKNFKKMPFTRKYPSSKIEIPKPLNYHKMIVLSEKLSQNTKFLRVDFYEIDGRLYFGELTFFPGNGTEKFEPEKYDKILGDWLELGEKNDKKENIFKHFI